MAEYFYYTYRKKNSGKDKAVSRKSTLEKYAQEKGLMYDESNVFRDPDTAKGFSEKKEWLRLEMMLREGDTVIFKNLTHFGRDPESVNQKYHQLMDMGVNMIFIDNPTISSDYINHLQKIATTRKLMQKCDIHEVVKLLLYAELDKVGQNSRQRSELVKKGMRESGNKPGRKNEMELMTKELENDIMLYLNDGTMLQIEIAKKHGISSSTIKKYVKIMREMKKQRKS